MSGECGCGHDVGCANCLIRPGSKVAAELPRVRSGSTCSIQFTKEDDGDYSVKAATGRICVRVTGVAKEHLPDAVSKTAALAVDLDVDARGMMKGTGE